MDYLWVSTQRQRDENVLLVFVLCRLCPKNIYFILPHPYEVQVTKVGLVARVLAL